MLGDYRPPKPSDEPPSFRDFDAYRYDSAKTHALLQQLIAVTCQTSAADVHMDVPVPEVEKRFRKRRLDRLRSTVARALGN